MLTEMGRKARAAARALALQSSHRKEAALAALAARLRGDEDRILAANAEDLAAGRAAGLSAALLDRLLLNPARLQAMAADLLSVAALPDPIGETYDEVTLPNGLEVRKQRVPIGVLAVIFEARPNVTVDVAGLCLKTSNAVILRGGSEAVHSNRALADSIRAALEESGLPADAVQLVADQERARLAELLALDDYIDMVIPRGGAALHRYCRQSCRIPVITGGIGICHLFVDESADLEAALRILHNAKVQRPTVCNALDTALIHQAVAAELLPRLVARLSADGVSFRLDPSAQAYLPLDGERILPAEPEDFDTEWLSLVLGLKVVSGLPEAIEHIARHSSGHSDGILTRDQSNADRFVAEVDAAAVYVNASTRFTDGGQLGLGAEVAISTQRLHARGPMGPRELTTYKWVIVGDGHVRP